MGALEGKVIILTGADHPHAPALLQALVDAGAMMACVASDPRMAARQLGEIGGNRTRAFSAAIDERSIAGALAAIIEALGEPYALVTCPPMPFIASSHALAEADIRAVWDVSLLQATLWCVAVGRHMTVNSGGVIVNVTGLSGLGGWRNYLATGMALAALHQLTHTLAVEWARDHVRVNALVPGMTREDAVEMQAVGLVPNIAQVQGRIPQVEFMGAADLGSALLYLLEPDASYISGESLRVDGGWDAWGRLYAAARPS